MSIDVSDPTYWKLALALAAPASFWFSFRSWRLARVIDDTPASRVRSAAQGYVELSGRASLPPKVPNLAPLSGRPCCWWRYEIEERSSGGKEGWTSIDSGVSEAPFVLADETGSCLVHPHGAEVRATDKSVWSGSEAWPTTIAGPGVGQSFFAGTGKYRYTEYRIGESELVHVIGDFRTVGGVSASDTTLEVMRLLADWKQDQPALLRRFDANHDGVLSMREWEAARAAARTQIEQRPPALPAPTANVIMKPQDARPFLVACYDLQLVARRSRWAAAGLAAVFVATVGMLAHLLVDGP